MVVEASILFDDSGIEFSKTVDMTLTMFLGGDVSRDTCVSHIYAVSVVRRTDRIRVVQAICQSLNVKIRILQGEQICIPNRIDFKQR